MLRYCFQNDSLERLNPLWPLLSGFKTLFVDKIGRARPEARLTEPVAPLFLRHDFEISQRDDRINNH